MRRRQLIHLAILALLRPSQVRSEGAAPPVLTLTAADLEQAGSEDALRLRPGLALPDVPPGLPAIDPLDTSPEAGLLRRRVAQGRAAGLAGVVYDNRDRDHSALRADLFPALTRLKYGPDLVAQGLDYGLARPILLPTSRLLAPVIGNSSTAVTAGAVPRSLPRLAMTFSGGPERAWTAWAGNQTYVYPEHHDHDAADLFPANWPYMLISQGSSYTDRPFLRAVGLILGALPPATRAAAEAQGLIGPVVQMLFRRGLVRSDALYLSGAAHPTVFDGEDLNPMAMMQRAAGLTPRDLPPLVRLQVLAEDFTDAAGLAGLSERLFDTPSAIARIWRGPAYSRSMVVSTALTDGAVARWHWVVLRGDPGRVRIAPQGAGGTARIAIDWQEARKILPGQSRTSGRADVGIFAETPGGQFSAPAFISVSFPLHEARLYADSPAADDGPGRRLISVDYDAVGRQEAFDPLLHWSAPWRDVFAYDPDGAPAGWQRQATGPEGAAAAGDYDAQGRRDGRSVAYELAGTARQPILQLR